MVGWKITSCWRLTTVLLLFRLLFTTTTTAAPLLPTTPTSATTTQTLIDIRDDQLENDQIISIDTASASASASVSASVSINVGSLPSATVTTNDRHVLAAPTKTNTNTKIKTNIDLRHQQQSQRQQQQQQQHSSRNVFASPTSINDIAVVMPFIASQTHLITDNVASWSRYLPCSPTDDPNDLGGVHARATLWLYFDGEMNPPSQVPSPKSGSSSNTNTNTNSGIGSHQPSFGYDGAVIRTSMERWWSTLPSEVTRCFAGGLKFVSANLSSSLLHPDGPCQMFYNAFTYFESLGEYHHLFWMEPDLLPVQSRWLTALGLEARDNAACQRFWQKGSISRCDASYSDLAARLDYHINGTVPPGPPPRPCHSLLSSSSSSSCSVARLSTLI
jgi:hypothetical protein